VRAALKLLKRAVLALFEILVAALVTGTVIALFILFDMHCNEGHGDSDRRGLTDIWRP